MTEPTPNETPSLPEAVAARSLLQWPLMVVVAGIVMGLGVVAVGQWRFGCVVIGASLGIGAVERLALADADAGLLKVRSKAFDVLIMLGMGAAIIALAILVPEGRPRR